MAQPKKQRLAVIGDPIAHSLSPWIQNAALKDQKLPFSYNKILVKPDGLKGFIRNRAKHLKGFNITIPHKESILPYLDLVVPMAKMIGAVNTVVRHHKQWIGFNTDGEGFVRSLREEKGFEVKKKKITILGAGGASRAICVALALEGVASLTLINRNQERGKRLVRNLRKYFKGIPIKSSSYHGTGLTNSLKNSHLLVNTTSIGMNGTRFEEFPWKHLKKICLVSDIVYTPRFTPFLKTARRRGHNIHTGEGMLVYQGALAFHLWTGHWPNVKLMKKVMLERLGR